MIKLRSVAFLVLAFLWTLVLSILYLPLVLLPQRLFQRCCAVWCRGLLILARVVNGLRYRIEGLDQLPDGPVIIAAKHQSAWDTLVFHTVLDDPAYVMKQELLANPLIGRYLRKSGNIGIDRQGGPSALKQMTKAVSRRLADGAQVIVFPEGTRVKPMVDHPYHPGIAALYARCDVPFIPVALNSGLFWGRWTKLPGEITVSILAPLQPGLERKAFMAQLKTRIDGETDRLVRAALENQGMPALDGTVGGRMP